MSITPQAIKDQEFQVKFRGYDTLEVKAYLELLAEEFFELHEQNRKMAEETCWPCRRYGGPAAGEKEDAQKDNRKHIEELEGLKDEIQRKETQNTALQKEVEELRDPARQQPEGNGPCQGDGRVGGRTHEVRAGNCCYEAAGRT